MCTAISVKANHHHYFGRNLDYEHTFGEKVVITPRNYSFCFRNGEIINNHYAMIGAALPLDGYPLYFEATNEAGLSMAGLNFPGLAVYHKVQEDKDNIASFECIPWVLSQCKTVDEAKKLLEKGNITEEPFKSDVKPTPLHWMLADKNQSLVLEQTKTGLSLHRNDVGVLTNNPHFDVHMYHLSNYMSVSCEEPENKFSSKIHLEAHSRGMGGLGLPGDLSSMSRFVKASFTKLNSDFGQTEQEAVHQFFHVLYSVYQQKGCVKVGDAFEITNYSSCCNTCKGIYYYTTYYNSTIRAVDMFKENLDDAKLICYDMVQKDVFCLQN